MKRHSAHKFVLVAFLIIMTFFSLPASASVGDFLVTWGLEYNFYSPRGIEINESGNVYVINTLYNEIQVISYNGIILDVWGSYGTEDGQFFYPGGIAVDGSGNVYVADTFNHRIQVFSSNGIFLGTWGSYGTEDGQFSYPGGIAVDGSGNVYIADTRNHRIQVFSSNGIFLGTWGSYGTEDGQFSYPIGIAVDGSGNVYVADTYNHRIQVFSSNGIFLGTWGSYGTEDGQFSYPYDVAVDKYSEVVYVVDTFNDRIQAFEAYPATNDVYNFIGFLPPLNLDKSFKRGSTIPVKFKLTDVDGNYISTAQTTIMLQKYLADEPIGEPIEPSSKGRSNIGSAFRYDELNEQYIYNLNTKELSAGIWQIIVFLDNSIVNYTFISLK